MSGGVRVESGGTPVEEDEDRRDRGVRTSGCSERAERTRTRGEMTKEVGGAIRQLKERGSENL